MRLEGNPTLRKVQRNAENFAVVNDRATVGGVAWKSVLLCLIVVVGAVVTAYLLQNAIVTNNERIWTILSVGLVASAIPMIIISFVIFIKPRTAPFLSVIYCLLDGALVGFFAGMVDMFYPGIALLALLGTCVVFLVTLTIFRLIGSRLSNGFLKFMVIASISLLVTYLLSFLLRLIFPAINVMFVTSPWLQLLVSGVCILWASFMLLVDFNNICRMTEAGLDKSYEWLTAFSLTTTLAWLYVEILELLFKLAVIFGNNKN